MRNNCTMQIKIIATGKLKEKSYREIAEEFSKRIRPFCSLKIIEIQAENLKTSPTEKTAREREAQRILPHITENSFVITMEIEGENLSSENFAKKITEISNSGINEVIFIIGGATGLDDALKNRTNFSLSFSKMTFTHQFARLMLLEQLYRAFKIMSGEPYHK